MLQLEKIQYHLFKIAQIGTDDDFSLLKKIMINRIETLPKYASRFQHRIALFTGNRFENCALSFFYIKNLSGDTIHFKPNIYFKNIQSIEGKLPEGLKLKNNDKYLYLGNRINADLPYQSGGKEIIIFLEKLNLNLMIVIFKNIYKMWIIKN